MAPEPAGEDLARRLDRNYRLQRHIYDASRKYYLLGRDALIADLAPPAAGHVLELGCGTARNLIAIARRHPGCRLYGVDLSAMMLETAGRSLRRAGLASDIRLARGDAAGFDARGLLGRADFDRIVFSYALSMIPPWAAALEHAAGLLAAGGEMHIVDFGRGDGLPGPMQRALRAWLARFHVHPRDGLEGELGRLAAAFGFELTMAQPWRGYAARAVLRRPVESPVPRPARDPIGEPRVRA